jgi:hypothetical protein
MTTAEDGVLDLAFEPDQTACQLWTAIMGLFEANKVSHALFLNHEFHSMTQGDLSIDAYCQKMKAMADTLRDVGHTIIDSQLILNLLCGLNPHFSSTTDNIADSNPLPNFATACEKLVLKELCLANKGQVTMQTALYVGMPSCGSASHLTSSGSGSGHSGGGYGSSASDGGSPYN